MSWIEHFFNCLKLAIPKYKIVNRIDSLTGKRELILVEESLIIHPLSLMHNHDPESALALQQHYARKGVRLIHLWEDIWQNQADLVISRIKMNLGLHTKVYARNTLVQISNAMQAKAFFTQNHQMGFINQRYYYSLRYEGDILAMATFGDIRAMPSKGNSYLSAELSRFACVQNYSVPGALSKLVHAFLADYQVNDMMSYADRDWSLGNSYHKVGFKLTEIQPPQRLYYHMASKTRISQYRLPKPIQEAILDLGGEDEVEKLRELGYLVIFNTGNLKYHLYV